MSMTPRDGHRGLDRVPGRLDDGPGLPRRLWPTVNALYVWLPLSVLFLVPFLPLRRRARRAAALLHLDLLVLLGFSISLAFFNHGEIGLSVPLAYPSLLYLLVRMLLLGLAAGDPGRRCGCWYRQGGSR